MSRVFLDILVVLVAAKVAAEAAERLRVPAVVGEILAGIVVGPSLLGWVERDNDVLRTLGEIGVILLLLEVGMEMDLRELREVGRASLSVAALGVALPMATGYPIARAFDLSSDQALFVAAALTATSVGITARVLGDLRALSTFEARTVLGAAVADDVIGLVILTVVVRLVTGDGGLNAVDVFGIVGLAVLFLVAATAVGSWATPRLFAVIDRFARSSGTLLALGLAFTLAVAQLASAAKLAPIVGAFVAGITLGRGAAASRIRRELTPVGHLFIPVFFLQIGIDSELRQFAEPAVLGMAAALLAVAVAGKVVAGVGAAGTPSNKFLIGLGMIPRGEVGLIFAGIGLREGILGDDAYAAILLVVLATTLLTPPILGWQYARMRRRQARPPAEPTPRPPGGWLVARSGEIELTGTPPLEETIEVAFHAARQVERYQPGARLVAHLRDATRADGPHLPWAPACTDAFIRLLESGGVRAWRFLETTAVLEKAMPELAETLRRRRQDASLLDPTGIVRWPLLERVQRIHRGVLDHPEDAEASAELGRIDRPEVVYLAALLIDATAGDLAPMRSCRSALERMVLDPDAADLVAVLVGERDLLRAAAVRHDALERDTVMRLAAHLGTERTARALYVLSVAMDGLEPWERPLLDELHRCILAALQQPELASGRAGTVLDAKRADAVALLAAGSPAADRIATAPIGYLMSEEPVDIARHTQLLDPLLTRSRYRVNVRPLRTHGRWRIEVAARDQVGLLAIVTAVLEAARLDVDDAVIATWADGAALQAFRVRSETPGLVPDPEALVVAISVAAHRALRAAPAPDAVITFDDVASPWSTIAEVRATDRRGLLHALAVAFATAGVDVHAARVTTADEMAFDRFDLTDRAGKKLDADTKAAVGRALRTGVVTPSKRMFRTNRAVTSRKQSRDE